MSPLSTSNRLLDDLLAELANRVQAGEAIDVEAVLREHPEHAAQLRRLLPAVQVLADLGRSAASVPPAVGDAGPVDGVLGDFRILREVGRGGMGVVYEAEQISLRRRVALKVLPFAGALDAKQLQRFKNEAQAAACLHHPHIVPVYFVGSERAVHFYAMQYIDGRTLADVLRGLRREAEPGGVSPGSSTPAETVAHAGFPTEGPKGGPGYFRRVAEWGVQAAEALEHAHEQGVVHRDIKPANLLLDGRGQLWVTDFGLAQFQAGGGLTMTGDLLGTLRYMSPEQALGKRGLVDQRSDVYALGVTLYELLTLTPPFPGDDRQELLRQIANDEPRPPRRLNPAVPVDLETIVLKAMAKAPAERYATAQELANDLRRFLDHKPVHARRPGLLQHVSRWAGRNQTVVAAGFAVLLLAVIALAISTWLIARSQEQAEERARDLVRQKYPADIGAAHRAWQAGNLMQARDLLARYLPQEGQEELRGFEWYYLWDQCRPLQTRVLEGHSDVVENLSFSPDGTLLATCSGNKDPTVRLWDVATGRERAVMRGHTKRVIRVRFSPNGKSLVSSSYDDNTVRSWEVPTGRDLSVWTSPQGVSIGADFLPNGTIVAVVVRVDGGIEIWEVTRGRKHELPTGWPFQRIMSGALSANAKHLALGELSGRLSLWNVEKLWERGPASLLHSVMLAGSVVDLAFTPDGKRLGAIVGSGIVYLRNVDPFQDVASFLEDDGNLNALAISPDGRTLASGGYDAVVHLRDVPARMVRAVLRADAVVGSLTFSPDGKTLASAGGDGRVRLHTLPNPPPTERLYTQEIVRHYLRGSPDGRTLATRHASRQGWMTLVWDRQTGQSRAPFLSDNPQGGECALVYSPDSTALAVRTKEGVALLDVKTGQPRTHLPGFAPAFTPDSRTVLVGSPEGEIRLWDTATGAPRGSFLDRQPGINCVAPSPDGQTLAIGHTDGRVWLWDLVTGRRRGQELPPHSGAVTFLVFSRDNQVLVTASGGDDTVHVWDVDRQRPRLAFTTRSYRIGDLGLSPDGRTLGIAAQSRVSLFHLATGQELFALERQMTSPPQVNFSSDGQALVTGLAEGNELIVWHAPRSGLDVPVENTHAARAR